MITGKKLANRLNLDFTIEDSDSAKFGNFIINHFYTTELVNSNGCHIHFWIPESYDNKKLENLIAKSRTIFDVISFSWNYLPDGDKKILGLNISEEGIENVIRFLSGCNVDMNLTEKKGMLKSFLGGRVGILRDVS